MKIKATKTFAAWINRVAKENGKSFSAELVKMSAGQYSMSAGDPFTADENGDYDYNTGLYNVIMVNYPAEFYAWPKYLTTHELQKECRRRINGGKIITENELKNVVIDLCEI